MSINFEGTLSVHVSAHSGSPPSVSNSSLCTNSVICYRPHLLALWQMMNRQDPRIIETSEAMLTPSRLAFSHRLEASYTKLECRLHSGTSFCSWSHASLRPCTRCGNAPEIFSCCRHWTWPSMLTVHLNGCSRSHLIAAALLYPKYKLPGTTAF